MRRSGPTVAAAEESESEWVETERSGRVGPVLDRRLHLWRGSKMTIDQYRDWLAHKVGSAQSFRARVAAQHPTDRRNQQSADALAKLARSLAQLPLDDPTLVQCFRVEGKALEGTPEAIAELPSIDPTKAVDAVFGRYGFDDPKGGDAAEFLKEYLEATKALAKAAWAEERTPTSKGDRGHGH
jgi:hypothetical protein